MKQAAVACSWDLEHKKLMDLASLEKGPAKKVYLNLHKAVKGDMDNVNLDRKYEGPMSAPGQKIRIYDMRRK